MMLAARLMGESGEAVSPIVAADTSIAVGSSTMAWSVFVEGVDSGRGLGAGVGELT